MTRTCLLNTLYLIPGKEKEKKKGRGGEEKGGLKELARL